MEYLCQLKSINFIKQEESYTSKANFFDELNVDYVCAFSSHYEKDEIEQAKKMTQMINGETIEAFQNNEHIDLATKGCSKGDGIQIIKDYFHLEDESIYAIGDSWNDLPMLNAVKNSYTFTYAHPEVQKHTKTIVNTLAKCIQDIEKDKK